MVTWLLSRSSISAAEQANADRLDAIIDGEQTWQTALRFVDDVTRLAEVWNEFFDCFVDTLCDLAGEDWQEAIYDPHPTLIRLPAGRMGLPAPSIIEMATKS